LSLDFVLLAFDVPGVLGPDLDLEADPTDQAAVADEFHEAGYTPIELASLTAIKLAEAGAATGAASVQLLVQAGALLSALNEARKAAGELTVKAALAVAHHTAAIHKAIQKSRPLKLAFPVPPPAQMLRRALMQPLRLELDMITSVLRSLGFGIREEELRKM
jgi:hypothetical protein